MSDIGQGEPLFPRNFRHVSTSRRAFVFRPGADASRALLGRFLGARARCARWGSQRALFRRFAARARWALLGRSWGAPQARAGRSSGARRALLRRARGALVGALLGRSSGAFRRARGALVGALVERSSGARGALVLGAPRALFRRLLGASGYHLGTTRAFYASPVLSWWHKVITQKHGHSYPNTKCLVTTTCGPMVLG